MTETPDRQHPAPHRRLTLIAGGIGAGKSVVSRILRLKGYRVYDTDLEARKIMDSSVEIRSAICSRWGNHVVTENNCVNRPAVAEVIFNNADEREWLNGIVHRAVREDLERWQEGSAEDLFVECAIPVTSGIAQMCGRTWLVTAPEDVRVDRVMSRNAMTREQVLSRIRSQQTEYSTLREICPVSEIVNDGVTPLLPQIDLLLLKL